ncbi:MAG: arginase [Geminicoccaceae bacterium]
MSTKNCVLVGLPIQTGTDQPGCLMGPDSYRTAGIADMIASLGHGVTDLGNLDLPESTEMTHPNPALRQLGETVAWTKSLNEAAYQASSDGRFPVFMGGDHSLSLGTVTGVARFARQMDQPQFVLWLDAHTDFHNPHSTMSGNLHGTPVAYFSGQAGFEDGFDPVDHPVPLGNICMIGIRSVDPAESRQLSALGLTIHDMRSIDEQGLIKPLRAFLDRVKAADGRLHVSLDVDFLDPDIAPAVGTTVPGGATFREAHLIMEMLHDFDLATSLDLAELNPFLDDRGRTAKLMIDLTASLLGRKVLDRPTRSF